MTFVGPSLRALPGRGTVARPPGVSMHVARSPGCAREARTFSGVQSWPRTSNATEKPHALHLQSLLHLVTRTERLGLLPFPFVSDHENSRRGPRRPGGRRDRG